MLRGAVRWWGGPAIAVIGLSACGSDPGPVVTPAEYRDALAAVCAETAILIDGLAQPDDVSAVGPFATAVTEVLRAEAESARALDVPADLDDDHRAFVRNTDEQAAAWADLSTTPSSDPAFADLTRRIGELTLGRNDLVGEMGVDACTRRVVTAALTM